MCMHDFIAGLSFLSSSAKLYNNNKTSTKIPGNFIFCWWGYNVGNHVIITDQSYLLIYLVGWIISLNDVVWADELE